MGSLPRARQVRVSLLVVVLVALVPAGLLPTPAVAGTARTRDASGDVRAKGLSGEQRKALDLVSVTAAGEGSTGLLVTATFRGNLERAIGRGRLKRALVALVLRPSSKAQTPAGILTEGGGVVGTTLRRTRSKNVAVVRDGRRLSFLIAGGGLADVKTIEVKVFAERPARSNRARGAATELKDAARWVDITNRRAADAAKLTATDLATTDCGRLGILLGEAAIRKDTLTRNEKSMTELLGLINRLDELYKSSLEDESLLSRIGRGLNLILGSEDPRPKVRKDLAVARALVGAALRENRAAQRAITIFEGRLDALIAERCMPPQTSEKVSVTQQVCSGPHGGQTSPLKTRVEAAVQRSRDRAHLSAATAAGATVTVTVTPPSGSAIVGESQKTVTLDGSGNALVEFTIREFGDYTLEATVRTASGAAGTSTQAFRVQSGQSCSF